MRLLFILFPAFGASVAQAQTISAVYFGQTHVLKATDTSFGLVGNRETLIKVHVTDPMGSPAFPSGIYTDQTRGDVISESSHSQTAENTAIT